MPMGWFLPTRIKVQIEEEHLVQCNFLCDIYILSLASKGNLFNARLKNNSCTTGTNLHINFNHWWKKRHLIHSFGSGHFLMHPIKNPVRRSFVLRLEYCKTSPWTLKVIVSLTKWILAVKSAVILNSFGKSLQRRLVKRVRAKPAEICEKSKLLALI